MSALRMGLGSGGGGGQAELYDQASTLADPLLDADPGLALEGRVGDRAYVAARLFDELSARAAACRGAARAALAGGGGGCLERVK